MTETKLPVDRLLHVADLHFWRVVFDPLRLANKRFLGNLNVALRRRHEFRMERAKPFADALAATEVRHVVLTGDFTSTSAEEEFELASEFVRGLQRRGLTLSILAGNHDVYTFEARRKRRFERCFAGLVPDTGFPARKALPGGTGLILMPTVCPNFLTARGRASQVDIEAAHRLLADCTSPVIVAAHYPVLHRTYGYASRVSRRLRNAEALRRMLGASGKRILYVCGHVHRFSYVQDPEYANVAHLSTGAFFRDDPEHGRQGEFSEIHVCDDGFRVFRHTHEGEWRRQAC